MAAVASFVAAAPALAAAPDVTGPADFSVNEDATAVLSSGSGNAFEVVDPDGGDLTIDVDATNGVVNLATTSGLADLTGDGTANMHFEGDPGEVDAALDGMSFVPTPDFNGVAEVSVSADDGAEDDSDAVAITVSAVNDNPVNDLPATPTIDEDTTLTLTGANAPSLADVDAGGDDLRLTLNTTPTGSFPTGMMTVDDRAGLNFTNGDGVDDQSMTFEGTLAEINAALDGMTFTPVPDMYGTGYGSGAGNIRFTANDLGHNPAPARTATAELAIHIDPVDTDPPTNHIVAGIGTYEDVPEVLSLANGNQLEARDLDNNELASDELEISLNSTHGTMTLASTTGLDFTTGDGAGDTAMTFTAARSDITGAFDTGLTFAPDSGFTGTAEIAMETEDLTNGGVDQDVGEVEVDSPEDTVFYGGSKVTGTTTVPHVQAVLGRAQLDGGGGANLYGGPTLADNPAGIAIDLVDEKIYWSVTHPSDGIPRIYRADLDGSGTPEAFVVGGASTPTHTAMNSTPGALVVDQTTRRLYWPSTDTTPPFDLASKAISYVSIDDAAPATTGGKILVSTGTGSGGPRPFVLDPAGERFFYGDTTGDAVGVAPVPGATGTNSRFTVSGATPSDPLGIAYDPEADRLYWGNSNGDPQNERVRFADLDGTTSITGQVFDIGSSTGGGFRGMALDPEAGRLYWGLTSGGGRIEHAALDGSGGDSGAVDLGDANHNSLDGVTLMKKPEPAGTPQVTGTAQVGQTLTCDAAWEGDLVSGGLYRMPKATSLEWTRNGAAIPGATSATYTPDSPGEYRCVGRASNFAGSSSRQSAALDIPAAPAETPPAETPPDDTPPVDTPPDDEPANDIELGNAKVEKKNGTAKLSVEVPGPGELELAGKGVKSVTKEVDGAGTETLAVKPTGKTKKKLKKKGKAKVSVEVTFTPEGGDPNSETKSVTLKQK